MLLIYLLLLFIYLLIIHIYIYIHIWERERERERECVRYFDNANNNLKTSNNEIFLLLCKGGHRQYNMSTIFYFNI